VGVIWTKTTAIQKWRREENSSECKSGFSHASMVWVLFGGSWENKRKKKQKRHAWAMKSLQG
jgi:hypothetical protein